jgi:hypothetical protein
MFHITTITKLQSLASFEVFAMVKIQAEAGQCNTTGHHNPEGPNLNPKSFICKTILYTF